MTLKIDHWERGNYPKKYTVTIKGKKYSFGDQRYQQYKDRSPLKLYSSMDHLDPVRRQAFMNRHASNNGIQGQLSKKYLW